MLRQLNDYEMQDNGGGGEARHGCTFGSHIRGEDRIQYLEQPQSQSMAEVLFSTSVFGHTSASSHLVAEFAMYRRKRRRFADGFY